MTIGIYKITGVYVTNILDCCKNKKKSAGRFIWKREKIKCPAF